MFDITSFGRKKRQPADSLETDPGMVPASFPEIRLSRSCSINFGRYVTFSVDVNSIQIVTAFQFGRKTKILDVRNVSIPEDIDSNDARQDFLSSRLIEYINRYGGWRPNVSLAISGKETVYRTFQMPKLKTSDLKSAIGYEAAKQLPFPIDDCVFDYRPMSRTTNQNNARYRIALCASTGKYVDEQLAPFLNNGIRISRIYHTHDVIGTLLTYLPDFNNDSNYTLMEVTLDHCTVSFYHGSSLEFMHHGSCGTSNLNDHTNDSDVEYFTESLAKELDTAQEYYSGPQAGPQSNNIYIFGDISRWPNLPSMLNVHTSYKFELFPVHRLKFLQNQEHPSAEFLPSCLPALAASVCRQQQINLLPPKYKERLAQRKLHYIATSSLFLLAMILMSIWGIIRQEANNSQQTLYQLEKQATAISQSESYHTYLVLKQEMVVARSYLERATPSPSYLNFNLKELSVLTPTAVRLFRLDYNPGEVSSSNLTLYGQVTASHIPSEVILAEYIENLRASQFYNDVSITRHSKKKIKNKFVIEFQIRMRATV